MANKILILLLIIFVTGCSISQSNPVYPASPDEVTTVQEQLTQGSRRITGFYNLSFPVDHSSCTVIPLRTNEFHLNAVKFLEQEPCTNCVKISKMKQLGNGVLEMDITISNPFTPLIYSAFDVRGIIYFDGSWQTYLSFLTMGYPEIPPTYVSWARLGDWELLNPDGYTYYWSPPFNADSQWDITKYLPGKFSSGTPTGRIAGYRDFYTTEDRHLFEAGHSVTQTYRIQTQPGPMVVGYAVDACWAQPTTVPVNNPLTDFPPSANCPEPYRFDVVINDGETVTNRFELSYEQSGKIKLFFDQWNGTTITKHSSFLEFEHPDQFPSYGGYYGVWPSGDTPFLDCDEPCGDDCHCGLSYLFGPDEPAGWYRLVTVIYWGDYYIDGGYYDHAVDITDFYYDPY